MQAPENAPRGGLAGPLLGPSPPFYAETGRTTIRIDKPCDSSISVRRFSPAASGTMMLHWACILGAFSMPTSDNPPFPAALRIFSLGVIIVLIVGAGLFFAPALVKPRWPWPVTPFSARFLGGFYTAEMAVMAALLFWNRWSPGRLVLVMAFIFTVIVSAVSLINLGYFNFGRKSDLAMVPGLSCLGCGIRAVPVAFQGPSFSKRHDLSLIHI